jgi:hypothetical protein
MSKEVDGGGGTVHLLREDSNTDESIIFGEGRERATSQNAKRRIL